MTDFAPIIQYVKDNACRPISTAGVAKEFSLSKAHLSRYFTMHAGEPLLTLRDRIRIEKAKQLLAHHGEVNSIASEVGFSSTVQFFRAFRKYANTTPMQFRKSLFQDPSLLP